MQSPVDHFIRIIAPLRAGRLTMAAAGTVLLYDILLTTSDEMKYIWPSKFSLPKFLYFMNRYFPVPCYFLAMYHVAGFRGDISDNVCKVIAISQLIGQQISLITATWLLVLRVLALYGNRRFVVIGLYTLFISTHLVSVVLSITIIHNVWDKLVYVRVIGICIAAPTHTLGAVYFTPVLCEVVLVIMQLLHAYRHARQLGPLQHAFTPLLRTLYLDGFAYFVVVATMRLWSSLTFTIAEPSYWYLPVYLEFSLISISVSRLVLHLREAAEAHHAHSITFSTSLPLSDMSKDTTRNHNQRRRHAQDSSWDSRPSSIPRRYSSLSYQYPARPPHTLFSRIQQVALPFSEHLHQAPSQPLSRQTDPAATPMGSGATLLSSSVGDVCTPGDKELLDGPGYDALCYASAMGSWTNDDESCVDSLPSP